MSGYKPDLLAWYQRPMAQFRSTLPTQKPISYIVYLYPQLDSRNVVGVLSCRLILIIGTLFWLYWLVLLKKSESSGDNLAFSISD